jgi:hypothetical protein
MTMYPNAPLTAVSSFDNEIVLGQIRVIEDCLYFSTGLFPLI